MKKLERRWSYTDLEKICELIREKTVGEGAATVPATIQAIRAVDIKEIYFYSWIATQDHGMSKFLFPEIISELEGKLFDSFHFDETADGFIRKFLDKGAQWLAYQMFLTDRSIYHRCRVLGLSVPRLELYSATEEKRIGDLVAEGKSASYIGRVLGRSEKAIKCKKIRLGVKSDKFYSWKPEQDDYIREHYKKMKYSAIAECLDVETWQVEKRAWTLGLRKKPKQYDWKKHPEAVEYIRENIAYQSNREMAEHLGLRKMQVEKKVIRMRKNGEL